MKKKTTAKLEEAWPAAATSIGARVRAFRRERKFSVAELALRAGVSTGIVSQIERDIANPSLRTLERIRAALDVPLMALLEEKSERAPSPEGVGDPDFVRRSQTRPGLSVGPHGVAKQLLSPRAASDELQFMIITVPPGVGSQEVLIGPGEKAGLMLNGKARLMVDGTEALLSEGDSFQFASTVPHSLHNDGDVAAVVLWIMSMKTPLKHL